MMRRTPKSNRGSNEARVTGFGPSSGESRGLCRRWAVLSAVGLGVGLPAGLLLLDPVTLLFGMIFVTPVVFGISGAILGTSQWFALRHVARAPLWIALCAVGLGLGLSAGTVAIERVGAWIAGQPLRLATASSMLAAFSFLALGAVGGSALGAAQWVVLRRWFRGGFRWISATGAALGLGMLAGFAVAESLLGGGRSPIGLLSVLAFGAVTTGVVTGRVLERYARDAAAAFRLSGEGKPASA